MFQTVGSQCAGLCLGERWLHWFPGNVMHVTEQLRTCVTERVQKTKGELALL